MGGIPEHRGLTVARSCVLLATVGLSLVSGTRFSPLFDSVFFLMRPFAPAPLTWQPMLLFYFTSLFLGLATFVIAGVPAAVYERLMGLRQSSVVSLGIWLAAALLLALPAMMSALVGP